MQAYSGDPDQTPRFVASDLGLHCLHIPNKYMGHKLNVVSSHQNQLLLSLYLLVSSADNFCKQFWPRAEPTKCFAWSGSKLFDSIPEIILEESADDKKVWKGNDKIHDKSLDTSPVRIMLKKKQNKFVAAFSAKLSFFYITNIFV